MDFFITIILAGVAGWLASLLYQSLDLSTIVYFFVGIIGGVVVNFIFKVFHIPFLSGYLGEFGFALLGSLLLYGIGTLVSRNRSIKN